jgi:hypothetical protein
MSPAFWVLLIVLLVLAVPLALAQMDRFRKDDYGEMSDHWEGRWK